MPSPNAATPLYFDAFTRFGPKPGQHAAQPWTLTELVAEMRHCSISGALVTSTATTLYDAMFENHRLCEALAPYDNLFPIWNVFPHWTGECPSPDNLIAELRQTGVGAVTLAPKTNGWELNARSSEPLLAALQQARIPAILDCRTEIEPPGLEQLLVRFPNLPVVLIGMSWSRQRCVVPLLLHHRNLHVAFDHFQINRGIEWLVAQGCADQLVYASNAVDMSMGAHRAFIDYAEVPEAVKAQIAGGNLIRLLKGVRPPRLCINGDEDALMAAARRGEPMPARVIDMHAHVLDEGLNGGGGSYTMQAGGPQGLKGLAARMGVKGIGLMSWNGTVGVHADAGNTCVRAALDADPGLFWGLATFDVVHESPDTLVRSLETVFADPRFLGLKPYPHYGRHYDHPAYEPLWTFGNTRGLYALLHPCRDDLSEFDALCPRYPNLTFVVAHCGGSYKAAELAIAKSRCHPNLLIEITLTPVCLGVIDYLVRGAGADRVVYGSDQPMRDPRQQMGWVVYSRLPVADKIRVLGANAQALLTRIRSGRVMPAATGVAKTETERLSP
jgi:predicted TIM-barrel fold metal-dependent hydrolase